MKIILKKQRFQTPLRRCHHISIFFKKLLHHNQDFADK